MKVIVLGATGMIGQGVLRECLLDGGVERVLAVGRAPIGQTHDKLVEIVHADLFDLSPIEQKLAGFDACFFCLGISAAGMRLNPAMTFVYVSGTGTDGSERGRSMWARVKGRTENALMRLPFKAAYMFRPGFVQPRNGIVSKTRLYRVIYGLVGWMYPMWKLLFPNFVTTTDQVGRAMLNVARRGAPAAVLENRDINAAAA